MTSSKPAPGMSGERMHGAPLEPTDLHDGARNPGAAFRPEWLEALGSDSESTERRAKEIRGRASTDEVAQLLQAVRLLDLTTLSDEDTEDTILRLCATALQPIDPEILAPLDPGDDDMRVSAVCVYDRFVATAREALAGRGVRVAAVTAGFPLALPSLSQRLDEIRATVAAGADEIDVVIDRGHVLNRDWRALYDEVSALRAACGPAGLKTILAAGDLGSLDQVARAGLVCCMAGADFIKTSTGREEVNATLPIGVAMAGAIRCYAARSGYAVGLKPAGGIRTAEDALAWLRLAHQELGRSWVDPKYFRLGASSLLGEIQRRLGEIGTVASDLRGG